MAVEMNGLNKIGPVSPQTIRSGGKAGIEGGGPSFKETLSGLQNSHGLNQAGGVSPLSSATQTLPLKFSNHAVDRMRMRGIQYGADQLEQISSAVEKARGKGAKETLVLTDESALIVSVKNNTVVTVMDKASLKENVFTNIDSTVVV